MNQQSDKPGTTEDLSFLKGASPIYVTTLSDNNVTPIGVNLNINNTQNISESNNNTSCSNHSSANTQSNIITNLPETKLKSNLNGNLSTGDLVNGIKSKKEVDFFIHI